MAFGPILIHLMSILLLGYSFDSATDSMKKALIVFWIYTQVSVAHRTADSMRSTPKINNLFLPASHESCLHRECCWLPPLSYANTDKAVAPEVSREDDCDVNYSVNYIYSVHQLWTCHLSWNYSNLEHLFGAHYNFGKSFFGSKVSFN